MTVLVDLLSWVLLLTGSGFVLVGALGVFRLPDFYCRLHGAGVVDTMGAGLIFAGMVLQAGFTLAAVKLTLILWFTLFTGPTASHALAKAARHGKLEPAEYTEESVPSNK